MTAFPVVGNVTFTNDWHDPRPGGWHEGNDIMSVRHQPAVAFEAGRVYKHGDGSYSCWLSLEGRSGMEYWYIHLNNDLGPSNDNDGGCGNGISWAPGLSSGDWVRKGELVGYVGDSGDANGIQPHLHFEIHRPSGTPINPYTHLQDARRIVYPRPAGSADIWLTFKRSRVIDVANDTVTIRTRTIVVQPKGWRYRYERTVVLDVPPEAVVERRTGNGPEAASLTQSAEGQRARVWTTTFTPSWRTQRARPGTLAVARVLIGDPG